MKNSTNKLQKAAQRKLAMEAGFFDGRFRARVVPNKKKAITKKRIKVMV